MSPAQRDGTPTPDGDEMPFLDPLDTFLRDKSVGDATDSGTYRRALERDVKRFDKWYRLKREAEPTFESVTPQDIRDYVRALRDGRAPGMDPEQFQGQTPSKGTVITYYSNLSAYIGWCVHEGPVPLDEHIAQADAAVEPVPEDDGHHSGDQQSWTVGQRTQLLGHLSEQANEIVDDADTGEIDERKLLVIHRDRALVATVAYTGIRGAELLRKPDDDRRNGICWGDVSFEDNQVVVLAKRGNATWSERALPEQAQRPLERLHDLLSPSNDDWPVFPSFHAPALYDTLRDAGVDAPAERESHPFDLCRDQEVAPPALSVSGAESVMERRTEEADIEVEDRHGYLTLHGARRHAGERMVRSKGFAAAARLLDDTERMVRQRYSHIEAEEFATDVTEAFE